MSDVPSNPTAAPAALSQGEPGAAQNTVYQANADALASLNSFPNFLPIGGDGPSVIAGQNQGQGLGASGTVNGVVPDSENNTRRVRGARVEGEDAVENITTDFGHPAFQESPYYFYVQKPGSDGEIFTPYMEPVQPHNLGRALPLQSMRYHHYHLVTEKPPQSWRMGITGPDVVAAPVKAKIEYLETPEINAYGLDTTF